MKPKKMFFPFAPGIPYNVIHPYYVKPEMNFNLLLRLLNENNVVVISNGGFLEAYLSCITAEMLYKNCASSKKYWSGDSRFNDLIQANGILLPSINKFPANITATHPVPLFLDRNNNCYMNIQYRYLKINPIKMSIITTKKPKESVIEQIVKNSLFPWDISYLPEMRKMPISQYQYKKNNITIIPQTELSIHKNETMKWTTTQIRAFCSLAQKNGFNITILNSKDQNPYYGCGQILKFNIQNLFKSITNSHTVLSSEIDFLILSSIISKSRIISNEIEDQLCIRGCRDFLSKSVEIIYDVVNDPVYIWETYFKD
jgi:hypothetical protein